MRALAAALIAGLAGSVALADMHELSFRSGEATLRALLHTPQGGAADTVVVDLQGNPGSPLAPQGWLVGPLLDRGVAVFRFNYRGLWGNDGEFHLTNSIGDLRAAMDFLTSTDALAAHGVTPERIVLIGYSYGTAVALVGAAADDRVAAIASLAPCDHGYFGAEFSEPNTPLRGFFEEAKAALFGENGPIRQDAEIFTGDLVRHASENRFPPKAVALRSKKLLFLVGLDDAVCPAEDHFFPLYRALRAASHPATDAEVLPMDHGSRPLGREAIATRLAAWVEDSGREELSTMNWSDERLEAFAQSYTAAWNGGEPNEVAKHYAKDGSLSINGGPPAVGREALAGVAANFMTGFPDLALTFDGLTFGEGAVRYHWTLRGTNTGPGGTGKRVRISGYEAWTLDGDGLVERSLGRFDEAEYRRQLEFGAGPEAE
jgi:pimeloyl-ACP methyl ester carboxylesterase